MVVRFFSAATNISPRRSQGLIPPKWARPVRVVEPHPKECRYRRRLAPQRLGASGTPSVLEPSIIDLEGTKRKHDTTFSRQSAILPLARSHAHLIPLATRKLIARKTDTAQKRSTGDLQQAFPGTHPANMAGNIRWHRAAAPLPRRSGSGRRHDNSRCCCWLLHGGR